MKKAEKYHLDWVKSGEAEGVLWVSLGFTSQLEVLDRLHVVCAMEHDEQDAKLRMDTIYLERFDQAYSCYHGADNIIVGSDGVHFKLNAHGQKQLTFSGHLHLLSPEQLRGWKSALKIFAKMSKYKCGEAITVD